MNDLNSFLTGLKSIPTIGGIQKFVKNFLSEFLILTKKVLSYHVHTIHPNVCMEEQEDGCYENKTNKKANLYGCNTHSSNLPHHGACSICSGLRGRNHPGKRGLGGHTGKWEQFLEVTSCPGKGFRG